MPEETEGGPVPGGSQRTAEPEADRGPAELPPPTEQEAVEDSALAKVGRLLRPGPIRAFLSTHEVHLLPYSVKHGQRARRVGTALLVVLVIFGAWYWAIPRTDVRVQAQYHEGLFNEIAVDLRITNDGTVQLSPLHVELVVTDAETHEAFGHYSVNTSVGAHATFDPVALEFKGDQVATNYTLSIVIRFNGGAPHALDFRTEEPYMNLYFDARIH